ncbi:EutP/PduV family microcompartment system protein [Bacillus badius]|uniref:Ethanolamine utilization protein EutP n=1 Tax=Bacillus badius TaxID=1455 RepID=A0ABR5AUZ7_BACBA|nr:EutP/PduV family microcompartment system protein [Bacillus badius]KIL76459.1 Ethanolamine utilization protein EutP [Bacillus badius]KIL78576.1 Ethanolamine utilization protein EutP [Bacillus badius]MED4715996.1 EutP/PduV family microcompartment system protein [Bacillus badius]
MNNRVMLIGSIGAGKSTLTNALLDKPAEAVKTQALVYHDWIVDTPGEYTENPLFYKNIMATALEVTHVFYIQDATGDKMVFPPGFSSGIPKLPVGVVTKADHPAANIEHTVQKLKQAVVEGPIVVTSALAGKNLQVLRDLAACRSLQEMKEYAAACGQMDFIFR